MFVGVGVVVGFVGVVAVVVVAHGGVEIGDEFGEVGVAVGGLGAVVEVFGAVVGVIGAGDEDVVGLAAVVVAVSGEGAGLVPEIEVVGGVVVVGNG